jgi:glycine oxidase
VNVIVIGAGIIGVSIADELARRGASVHVLDMRSPGRGASQASAGILAPYTEAHERTHLLEMGTRSLALFDAFVAGAVERSGRPVEYARTGTLEIALNEEDESRLRASRAWLNAIGVRTEWLTSAEVRDIEPAVTPAAAGGLLNRAHGFAGVTSLVTALAESAKLAGASFETPAEAVEIAPKRDGGADVRAGDRRYSADIVVLAAGSWSGRVKVTDAPALPVRPVRGQLLHLRWPEQEGRPSLPLPSRVVWGSDCYTVPWSDGSLLVGATVEDVGFDERVTLDGVRGLAEAAAALLPGAKAGEFVAARAGLRPASPDGLPIIGPLPSAPAVIAATGHYRNGVLLAPLTAAIVADAVLDGRQDQVFAVTTPARFLDQNGGKNRTAS